MPRVQEMFQKQKSQLPSGKDRLVQKQCRFQALYMPVCQIPNNLCEVHMALQSSRTTFHLTAYAFQLVAPATCALASLQLDLSQWSLSRACGAKKHAHLKFCCDGAGSIRLARDVTQAVASAQIRSCKCELACAPPPGSAVASQSTVRVLVFHPTESNADARRVCH